MKKNGQNCNGLLCPYINIVITLKLQCAEFVYENVNLKWNVREETQCNRLNLYNYITYAEIILSNEVILCLCSCLLKSL